MTDPIAITLRTIIVLLAAVGAVSVLLIASALPPFGVACYLLTFAAIAAVGIFGL